MSYVHKGKEIEISLSSADCDIINEGGGGVLANFEVMVVQ